MSDAIVVRGVSKSFGDKVAVRDLDLVVPTGSLYGFIGPNGAGKTTTIRMIMSILFPDRGSVSVLGHASALEAKDRIGYLPEERGLYRKMKVGAFLTYMARLKGSNGSAVRGEVRQWLERVGLAEVENKRCEELSKGMQQKLQFLAAVIHKPDLLILDEPFSGLDPVNMRMLRDLFLEQHRRGVTIIFSTHVMSSAEQLCDRVVMINQGIKVLDEPLSSIRARFDPRLVLFEPLDAATDAQALARDGLVQSVTRRDGRFEVLLREGVDPGRAIRELVAAVTPLRVELHRPTLEDVFIELVAPAGAAQEAEQLRAALRASQGAEAV
jgi:ABC-2 type transport system ATP-binding protein